MVGTMKSIQTIVRLLAGNRPFRKAPRPIQMHTNAPCGMPSKEVLSVSKLNGNVGQ